jgi:hypothetical protein
MRTAGVVFMLFVGAALSACASAPERQPISQNELLELSRGGPGASELEDALTSRPIGFRLSYGLLRDLETKGVAPETLDRVIENHVQYRGIEIATAYGYWWYPYYGPWPYYAHVGTDRHNWYWR